MKNSTLFKFLILFLSCFGMVFASESIDFSPKIFHFSDEDIDVVIPACPKDLSTLELSIAGIKANGHRIRRVIVVSQTRLTNSAEWFDESLFPFTKSDIATALMRGDAEAGAKFAATTKVSIGWYYQQLLKFYAPFVIPGISSNVLVLDSDTIFLHPVKFLTEDGAGLYNVAEEMHGPYFFQAKTLLPGFFRVNPKFSGITHHMLFQREILEDLFYQVENYHQMNLWEAFCRCVSAKALAHDVTGASEYEVYFNYVFRRTPQVRIRHLKWDNAPFVEEVEMYRDLGYEYVSCHDWLREYFLNELP